MAKRKGHRKLGSITRGLLIQSPHIEKVLSGKKTWEIRGYAAKIRGPIALHSIGVGPDCRHVQNRRYQGSTYKG